ncbi:MAG: PHP domain-containing protein [Nitrospirota bacterium]
MKLKVDLHIHTNEDISENISYSAIELIDNAVENGFDALSITNHNVFTYNDYLKGYAEDRGILLIPGIELTVSNRHILFINPANFIREDITTLDDVRRYKGDENLIIAPHPFFPCLHSLREFFSAYIDIFDAVEYTHFYFKMINFNKKAEIKAREHCLPLVANSDAHFLNQFGKTYSLVNAERNIESIIDSIKNHHVELVTKPLNVNLTNISIGLSFVSSSIINMLKKPV